ncbi:MAG: FMN-dependent NADH-azoreductase [Leptolyngbyaceae cyanobacterium SU_3_3]|nr:FMN-dependent NADH-azoreductase [Leptolyngbyaceae cyanobacterium SU_3_3]
MVHLLHIDSSPRGARSHSRRLSREFVEAWKQSHPTGSVSYRDLGHNPPPHVDEAWIAAAFTSPEQRTSQMWEAIEISDRLVDEFLTADVYVIGIPMYNFTVPSTLKAYIDQIVRVGRTWLFEPEDAEMPYKTLVHNKKMFVITARGDGGYDSGGRNEKLNHQDPYIKTVFAFMGITDLHFIHVENDEFGGKKLADSITNARTRITELVAA